MQKVWLIDDSTQLLERLRETLKSNDEGIAFLGSKSFGLLPYNNNHLPSSVEFGSKFSPDTSQQRAITLALGREVTYIIGPPGTGKTSTLAAIAFSHLCAGHSVLIAAHTNIAIDNAIMRLVDICNDSSNSTALQALEAGRLIRYGTPQLEDRLKDEYGRVHLPDTGPPMPTGPIPCHICREGLDGWAGHAHHSPLRRSQRGAGGQRSA